MHSLHARWLLLGLLGSMLGACRTTETSQPAGIEQGQATVTRPLRAWRVREDGTLRGVVIEFADPAQPDDPGRRFYSVRNPWQQELGMIDANGRAWRFVPPRGEARWIATGTLVLGANAILELGPSGALEEAPLEELRRVPEGT
ncbi:MAG TPA: hypothetical protein VMS76_15725 [Planctomycetota bacterium]|nr:hypothetical protein [Planctomycetota bacterium]